MRLKAILCALMLTAMSMPAIADDLMVPISLSGLSSDSATGQVVWMPAGQMVSVLPVQAASMYTVPWSASSRTKEPIQLSGSRLHFAPKGWYPRTSFGSGGGAGINVDWMPHI